MQTGPNTDFWRLTAGGYVRDSGHFYYQHQIGDFQADVCFKGEYQAMYDQAGLMVRVNEATWLKCGIELVHGRQQVSAVVTREYSDWSMIALPGEPEYIWLRVHRRGNTIEIHYALDGHDYQLLRQTYLSQAEAMDVGLMCASPEGHGFLVRFEDFTLQGYESEKQA
jgi:regulation of enolase protein 1 (concanavalin A-like superfamily)